MPSRQRFALIVAVGSLAWTLIVVLSGGLDTSIAGVRVRATEWLDPAIVALIAGLVLVRERRRARGMPPRSLRARLSEARQAARSPSAVLVACILAVAALARFWGLSFGLPHPAARPDEDAIDAIAHGYLAGHYNPKNFTYPPLFMIAVAAVMWIAFRKTGPLLARFNIRVDIPSDASVPAERMIARTLSAAAGVASVWVVFRVGARLFDRTTGLLAAAFLALAFLHVRDSHFGVTDVPMTFMVIAGFLAITRVYASGSTGDLIRAGIVAGLATATKYNAGLLVLPAAFAIVNDPAGRSLAGRLARLAAFCAVMAGAFLVVCPFAVFDYRTFVSDLSDVSTHLANGQGPDLGTGWTYHLTFTLRYGLGLPLLAAAIAGLPLMIWREGRRGILVVLFPFAYYAVMGTGRTVFARYALPVVPFLCLSAGYTVAALTAWMSRAAARPQWRPALAAAVATLVLLPSARSVLAIDRLFAREDTRVAARQWLEAHYPAGTRVAQLGLGNAHVYAYYEQRFALSGLDTMPRPDIVIVLPSALGSPNLAAQAPWVEREYDVRFSRRVVNENDPANVYDRQDEFFMPYAGFHDVSAPGPNVSVYVRRGSDARPVPPPPR